MIFGNIKKHAAAVWPRCEPLTMISLVKAILRKVFPHKWRAALSVIIRNLKLVTRGIAVAPEGTDFVGYETLIEFIKAHRVLERPGDVVEIGAFLGGGTLKLSRYLKKISPGKRLFVIDIFEPGFDRTTTQEGRPMTEIYSLALGRHGNRTQWEIFSEVTRGCGNVSVLKGDSRSAVLPCNQLCFAFIDGNHDAAYVENDFRLIWEKLSPGGAVGFHDYEYNLPEVTETVNELAARHASDIFDTFHDREKHIFFLIRGPAAD